MNKRIQELSEQALEIVSNKRMLKDGQLEQTWDPHEYDQVFAELIVRECANHCDLLLDHKMSSEWSRGTHDCSKAIKKHFGVEE
jgi:hypothetical protein